MRLHHLPVVFIEEIASPILIRCAITQEVIDDHQDAMADGDSRAFGSAPGGDATIRRGQRGLLAMGSGRGCLNQESASVGIPLAGLATESLARTFMIAR